jgi:MoxR-like ATPase
MYRTTSAYAASVEPRLDAERFRGYLAQVRGLELPADVYRLVNRLVRSTRPQEPDASAFVRENVNWGAGPRAAQAILAAVKARAALHGRPAATREDVRAVYLPALRHRLVLTYHAQAERIGPDAVLKEVAADILGR